MARRSLLVEASFEHAVIHEPRQPGLKHVACDPQVALYLVEAAKPEEHVADDQQRPALADYGECAGDAARLVVVVVAEHPRSF